MPARRAAILAAALLCAARATAQPPAGAPVDSEAQIAELMKKVLAEKVPPPVAPLPPPPADRRSIEGTWIADQLTRLRTERDVDGRPIPRTPHAQAILDRRVKAAYAEHAPYANAGACCLPPGAAWQIGLLYPFQVFQTRTATVFLFSEYHTAWNIRMDQPHRTGGAPDYMGDPVGHWDGDTLVVDTVNFRRPLWLDADGSPASTRAHIVYRIARTGAAGDGLRIAVTVDDPENYRAPWTVAHSYAWRPDMEHFAEYDCESVVGGSGSPASYGLRAEPGER